MMLSVIIPVWKRHLQLEVILTNLNDQAQILNTRLEIVLCDSHSGTEIDSVVARCTHNLKSLSIIHSHTKNVVAAKRNHGVTISTGSYIVFLDDDCIPSSDFLQSIFDIIKEFKVDTVYCGEVRFEEDLVNTSNYYRYRDSKHPVYNKDVLTTFNEWTFVSMNCLMSRDTFDKHNIFYNENFLGYGCEDHEFPWRLRESGISIEFSKQKIYHHEYGGDILKYANKIRSTARDGMFVLLHTTPEIIQTNKKLRLVEQFFGKEKEGFASKCIKCLFFSDAMSKLVATFLLKHDSDKKYYIPLLFRYVLICSYIKGLNERGKIDRDKLLNNWYI